MARSAARTLCKVKPVNDGGPDACRELVEEGEGGAAAEHGVAEEHDIDVAQPLDLAEGAEQIEVGDT